MIFIGTSIVAIALQLLVLQALYFLTKCIYRLTLHPLARFPGPKKAAMTRLYAISHDMPQDTSYVKEFTTWHDRYSSTVVRIEPNHLHILDIDAYNEIFKIGTKYSRDPAIYSFPATAGSLFNDLTLKIGLPHRGLYNQYFSKAAVQNLEPVIRDHLSQFLSKIDGAAGEEKSVDLTLGFRCLMGDTLMRYCYDKPFGALEAPDFQDPMIMGMAQLLESGPAGAWYGGRAFVAFFNGLMTLPRNWVPIYGVRETFRLLDGCYERITALSKESKDKMTPNVFQTALNPKVEKGQPKYSLPEIAADGLVFFVAGSDTTATALTFATYHLILNPPVLAKLRSELTTAIPTLPIFDPTTPSQTQFPLTWSALIQLPYLQATIKECLRKSYGVPGKIPRVVPPEGATLAGHFIPGGTTVSSTAYAYLDNPQFYPSPDDFKPERWLQDKDGGWSGNGGVDPEKYFVVFSRGSRACMGTNLAYAQLSYTLAYLVRAFEMRLEKGPGGMKDGDMGWIDCFATATVGHLKVKARRVES